MFGLPRPEATTPKLKADGMLRSEIAEISTMNCTTPAAAAALPTFGAVVQEFKTADAIQADSVCSGTWIQTGDTFCFLMHDALVSTTAEYCTKARRVMVPMTAGKTASQGNLCFMNATTFTCSSVSADGEAIGIFVETAVQTDPTGLPAGDWALIEFDGRANIWQS